MTSSLFFGGTHGQKKELINNKQQLRKSRIFSIASNTYNNSPSRKKNQNVLSLFLFFVVHRMMLANKQKRKIF
jgi:hypothetical protein